MLRKETIEKIAKDIFKWHTRGADGEWENPQYWRIPKEDYYQLAERIYGIIEAERETA